jgi:hypothetical protein
MSKKPDPSIGDRMDFPLGFSDDGEQFPVDDAAPSGSTQKPSKLQRLLKKLKRKKPDA